MSASSWVERSRFGFDSSSIDEGPLYEREGMREDDANALQVTVEEIRKFRKRVAFDAWAF